MVKSFSTIRIDVLDVIKAASTKPFSFLPYYPGCDVRKHCNPVDRYYLIRQAEQVGANHKLLKMDREIDEDMTAFTRELQSEEPGKPGRKIKDTKLAIMGLTFKSDVADIRESPASKIIYHYNKIVI